MASANVAFHLALTLRYLGERPNASNAISPPEQLFAASDEGAKNRHLARAPDGVFETTLIDHMSLHEDWFHSSFPDLLDDHLRAPV